MTKDVTDATFNDDVVERSKSVPVVVDLWAPWCGPCRALTPVLERVADDCADQFELVKINIDENPNIATQLGARSIPLVIAFKDGQPVSQFVGAQPEGAVREFIGALAPSQADLLVEDAGHAKAQGRTGDAETILRAALTEQPHHDQAPLMLAQLLADRDRMDEAMKVLDKADPSPQVEQLRSTLRLNVADDLDLDDLRSRAVAGDAEAAVQLGNALHAHGDNDAALQTLLQAVQDNPRDSENPAKQAMLDLFNVLGGSDPVVRNYRSKLARTLH